MNRSTKARVFMNGRSQHVTIPAKFRFRTSEVYIERDPQSGVITLSEKPIHTSMEAVFAKFDEAGAADFMVERDVSLPVERFFGD